MVVKMAHSVPDIAGRSFRPEGSAFFIKGSARGICGLFRLDGAAAGGISLLGEDTEAFVDEACLSLMGSLLARSLPAAAFSPVSRFPAPSIVDSPFEALDSL